MSTEMTIGCIPKTSEQAMKLAKFISTSNFCPKTYHNKPGDIVVAIQMGAEVGLKPMQALQGIACINGVPTIWGDAMLALCRSNNEFEYLDEFIDDSDKVNLTAICKVKRKGEPVHVCTFSQEDAKTAGLFNKSGPWKSYPKRMLQMRARGFALRNTFADSLKGLKSTEEVRDYEVIEAPKKEPKKVVENPTEKALEDLKKMDKTIDITNKVEEPTFTEKEMAQAVDHEIADELVKEESFNAEF